MLGCSRCLILCSVLTWTKANLFQSYIAETDLDDTVFYDSLRSTYNSDSLTLCSAMCGETCYCFGYSSMRKTCHLYYKFCYSLDKSVSDFETGWRYFEAVLKGEGWMSHGTHTYSHIKSRETWRDAKFKWEKLGAYLVTIETEEENSWLKETFLPVLDPAQCNPWWDCCSHWIGANDEEVEGRFVWTENNRDVTSYSNWHPGEPDNVGEQDCVYLCRDGIWGTGSCQHIYSYICEKD